MEIKGKQKLVGYQYSAKYLFMFSRIEGFIQVWNNMRVSKWQNFHFWVNYPLKKKKSFQEYQYTTMVLQKNEK